MIYSALLERPHMIVITFQLRVLQFMYHLGIYSRPLSRWSYLSPWTNVISRSNQGEQQSMDGTYSFCAYKKSGELQICVNYRALNMQSVKDSYSLPLPDEIQDHLDSLFHPRPPPRVLATPSSRRGPAQNSILRNGSFSAICRLAYQEHQGPFSN